MKMDDLSSSAGSLLERLRSKSEQFSPKQYILARFVAQNYEDLAYSSITELSFATGVSEPSITRFARFLEYDGFPGLQRAIREQIDEERRTHDFVPDLSHSGFEGMKKIVDEIFSLEGKSIEKTYKHIQLDVLEAATDCLVNADQIVSVAHGLNYFMADYAASYLGIIRKNVRKLTSLDIGDFPIVSDITDKTVILTFSFPRYSTRTNETLRLLRSHNPNSKIIGLTDSVLSPLGTYCDYLLMTPQWTTTFIDLYGAAMIMIHTLLYSVFLKNGKDTAKRVREYDNYVVDKGLVAGGELTSPQSHLHRGRAHRANGHEA